MPLKNLPKYSQVFVETGSYAGHGIDKALKAGYRNIISIEVNENHYQFCKDRFDSDPRVELHLGDSAVLLHRVTKDINEPITFWLDAHFSEADVMDDMSLCPLMQELDVIKNHHIKGHTVLIDDLSCWYGMENIYHDGFNFRMLLDKLKEVNPNYLITIEDGQAEDGTLLQNDILCGLTR